MSPNSQPRVEKKIKYVISPDMEIIDSSEPPIVGNSAVWSQTGSYERPIVSRTKAHKQTFTLPHKTTGNFALNSNINPAYIQQCSALRDGIGGNRLSKSEKNTPINDRLDLVDPRIVQNAGQFEKTSHSGRDHQLLSIYSNGGNIIFPGPQGGISTRNIERTITNLCN